MQDSRDVGERMRVALPVAHTKAVLEMDKMADEVNEQAFEDRGKTMQARTDFAYTVDKDAPYVLHFKDTAHEWDEKVEAADKRLDFVRQNDWAFSSSSESLEEDTQFSHNYQQQSYGSVREMMKEESSSNEEDDTWLFPGLEQEAKLKEEEHNRTFTAHEESVTMSEESWLIFMGRVRDTADLSIGKTMGKGRDFVGYENLSHDPWDRWYTDEEGRDADELPPENYTKRDWSDPSDPRHQLPDNPDHMEDAVKQAYYKGFFDPEADEVKTSGAESSNNNAVKSSQGKNLPFNLNSEGKDVYNLLWKKKQTALGTMAERNRHRAHRMQEAGFQAKKTRAQVDDRMSTLTEFIADEAKLQKEKNEKELLPYDNPGSTQKYADLLAKGKVIRELNPAMYTMLQGDWEQKVDEYTEEDSSDEVSKATQEDDKSGEEFNLSSEEENDLSDVSDFLSSPEEEYVDASDEGDVQADPSLAAFSSGEESPQSDEEVGARALMKSRPTRGDAADPYYSIWKDYTSEEEDPNTTGATNPLSGPSNAADEWGKGDRDDFASAREQQEWNAFNFTDPVQAAFFQEFNPHDFSVPQAEKYVYDSKDPHDRPWRLSDRVKKKMYELHTYNPTKWHARSLAALFKISSKRADAILKLQALEAQYVEEGYPLFGFEESAAERIWPSADAVWDEPYVPVLNNAAPVVFADEVQQLDDIERTRRRQDRLRVLGEQLSEIERDYHKDMGAYGRPVPIRAAPGKLDNTKFHPARYSWVMTDISDSANNNYSIAVRDRDGSLREPNSVEYDLIRKKEKRQTDEFYYVQYQEHIPTLHKSTGYFRKYLAPPVVTNTREQKKRQRQRASKWAAQNQISQQKASSVEA